MRMHSYQNAFEWREMLQGHLVLRGNAYNRIVSNARSEITQLNPTPLGVQHRHRVAVRDRHHPAPQLDRVDAGGKAQHEKQEGFHGRSTSCKTQICTLHSIPYIAIDDRYFKPHTGIVLIQDSAISMPPDQFRRLVTEIGAAVPIVFSDHPRAFRAAHGNWSYVQAFEVGAKPVVDWAGTNPLVLHVKDIADNGDLVIASEQRALLQKVIDDPRNQLLGGVIFSRTGSL